MQRIEGLYASQGLPAPLMVLLVAQDIERARPKQQRHPDASGPGGRPGLAPLSAGASAGSSSGGGSAPSAGALALAAPPPPPPPHLASTSSSSDGRSVPSPRRPGAAEADDDAALASLAATAPPPSSLAPADSSLLSSAAAAGGLGVAEQVRRLSAISAPSGGPLTLFKPVSLEAVQAIIQLAWTRRHGERGGSLYSSSPAGSAGELAIAGGAAEPASQQHIPHGAGWLISGDGGVAYAQVVAGGGAHEHGPARKMSVISEAASPGQAMGTKILW